MIREYLQDYGYSDDQIEKILEHKKLNTLKDESLFKIIPRTIRCLESLGFNSNQIIKITSSLPPIFGHSEENLRAKVDDMESLGYTRKQIIRMASNFASIFTYGIGTMKKRIEDIEALGYRRRQVLGMTLDLPSLYGRCIENISSKISEIEALGYTREEVLRMTVILPSLFSYSIENIKEKLDLARSIGIESAIIENPRNLMQSADLTYARFRFLMEECDISGLDLSQVIFRNALQFQSKFKITKKELLDTYSYSDYRRVKGLRNS